MFSESMAALREHDPSLFEEVGQLQTMLKSSVAETTHRTHEKLVELTWDVIAAFMLPSDKPTRTQARRLDRLAKATGLATSDGIAPCVDVG